MPIPARKVVAQTGRRLGPRALKTRSRLMEATADLLKEGSVLDVSVVEITRKVGTSPATFYHYFKDVEEVALALAEEAARGMPAILDIIDGQWSGESGLKTARTLVDAFISHWDKHHAVLQLRNMAADQGDRRFARVRRATLGPLLERLAETVKTAQREGRLPDALHPYVTAAALAAILERLSAYHRELERSGARRGDFVETCARILHQTLDGSSER